MRTGQRGTVGPSGRVLVQFEVSPDEKRSAVFGADETGRNVLSEMDLKSGILSPVTVDGAPGDYAAWSPDGREIALTARALSGTALVRKTLEDASPPKRVYGPSETIFMVQWLPNHDFLLYLNMAGRTFYRLRLEPGAKPEALLTTEYDKDEPQVSADARSPTAPTNQDSGKSASLLFRNSSSAVKSPTEVACDQNGGETEKPSTTSLLRGELVVGSATPGPGAAIETGAPRVLFKTKVNPYPTRDQFAVLDGGRKFLVLEPSGSQTESITVLLNWEALLDQKQR